MSGALKLTRAEIYVLIYYNARIRYRDRLGYEHEGIVIGDGYARWNGKFSYTLSLRSPHAFSISACRPDEIVEILNWNIPEEYREPMIERVREMFRKTYFDFGALLGGVPEIEILKGGLEHESEPEQGDPERASGE
jgi:hypothetical protein